VLVHAGTSHLFTSHSGQRYAVIVEGKSQVELDAYGKDYYYMQFQDFQNAQTGGPPPGFNGTFGGNGTRQGGAGSPTGAPQNGTAQVVNSQPTGQPTQTSQANVAANNFAAQQPTRSDPSNFVATGVQSPDFGNQMENTQSAALSQGSPDVVSNGPDFSDMVASSSPSQTSNSDESSNHFGHKRRRQGPPGGVGAGAGGAGRPPAGGGGGFPGGSGGPGGPGGPGGGASTPAYAVLTYKTSSGSVPQNVFTTPLNNLTDNVPNVFPLCCLLTCSFLMPLSDKIIKTLPTNSVHTTRIQRRLQINASISTTRRNNGAGRNVMSSTISRSIPPSNKFLF
jgi:hypothetical protein